jgi:hypothetical protein
MSNQPEIVSLDLTKFAADFFSENNEYNLKKEVDNQKHFEPIPNNFYGFDINVKDLFSDIASNMQTEVNTIDIEFEDLSNQKLIE